MKPPVKLLSIFLASVLCVAALPLALFAQKPKSIRFDKRFFSLAVGNTAELDVTYYPDDADEDLELTWSSSDPDIADVEEGTVTAYSPGTCTITARTPNAKRAECTVRVPGKLSPEDREWLEEELDDGYLPTVSLSYAKTSRETLQKSLKNAKNNQLTMRNVRSIDTALLRDVGPNLTYNFDTVSDDKIVVRLTVTPDMLKKLSGAIKVGAYCGTRNVQDIETRFNRYFTNTFSVIHCEQASFNTPVKFAVRAGDLDTSNLYLYRYDTERNEYSRMDVNLTVDKSGFVHFTTARGGYMILSDGPLTKKAKK